ncbi:hypothetical protein DFAR_2500013 [Desulfarculales bacterium]
MNHQGAAFTTAAHLLTAAVEREFSTICFTRSCLHTELIYS